MSKQLQTTFKVNLNLICSRDYNHRIEIFLKVNPDEKFFIKIGQYPSSAALAKMKFLNTERFLETTLMSLVEELGWFLMVLVSVHLFI
jgi:hypothetical protein